MRLCFGAPYNWLEKLTLFPHLPQVFPKKNLLQGRHGFVYFVVLDKTDTKVVAEIPKFLSHQQREAERTWDSILRELFGTSQP